MEHTEGTTPGLVGSSEGLGLVPEQAGWALEMHGHCVAFANNAEKERGMSPGCTTRMFTEAQLRAAVAAERERCALQVPLNWCDPLLTGPKSVVPATTDCRVIERLLQAVQARIRGA